MCVYLFLIWSILGARAEIWQKFRLLFGQCSFKKKCLWDLLTFSMQNCRCVKEWQFLKNLFFFLVVPQPVYMNMNDLNALAAQKAASSAETAQGNLLKSIANNIVRKEIFRWLYTLFTYVFFSVKHFLLKGDEFKGYALSNIVANFVHVL